MTFNAEVLELIELLECTTPLKRAEINRLYQAHKQARRIDFLAPQQVQDAQGRRLQELLQSETESERTKLWNMSLFPDHANNVSLHSALLVEQFNRYLVSGDIPPPASARRITVVLRKAKEHELDGRFLNAWCKHFGRVAGTGYEQLAMRQKT